MKSPHFKIWDNYIQMAFIVNAKMISFGATEDKTVVEGDGWVHTTQTYSHKKLDRGTCISIVDARESKKLWMMHVAAFAADDIPAPIYGFDIITSPTKVTGCFHDLSQTVHDQLLFESDFVSKRTRELPDWAKEIFSSNMIATALPSDDQIPQLVEIGLNNLDRYLNFLKKSEKTNDQEVINHHCSKKSKYCYNQLQNTNSKNVMVSLGLEKEYVESFKKQQFPH